MSGVDGGVIERRKKERGRREMGGRVGGRAGTGIREGGEGDKYKETNGPCERRLGESVTGRR